MFDANKEFEQLLKNVDGLLKTAQQRVAAAPGPKKTAAQEEKAVAALDEEARVVTASLRELITAREKNRADKVAAARFITQSALRLFACGAVNN